MTSFVGSGQLFSRLIFPSERRQLDDKPGFFRKEDLDRAFAEALSAGEDESPAMRNALASPAEMAKLRELLAIHSEDGRTVSIAYVEAVLEQIELAEERAAMEETEAAGTTNAGQTHPPGAGQTEESDD